MSKVKFRQAIKRNGVKLDLKTQMLCHDGWIYMNGESHQLGGENYKLLRALADERELPALADCSGESCELLYQWYLDGYIYPA